MIKLSPVPIYWILKLTKPQQLRALELYQMEVYGYVLDIPRYPGREYFIAPIILTTEEADRLMRQKPQHPARVK